MNTMTNAMTWDAIAANEGSAFSEMSLTEIGDVSGAGPWHDNINTAAAVVGAASAVVAVGHQLGWW